MMVEGSQGFIAIAEYSGSVMVQVCGVVDEVSTCHMIKLLRVGSNDFVFFFSTYLLPCLVHNKAAHFDLGICFESRHII